MFPEGNWGRAWAGAGVSISGSWWVVACGNSGHPAQETPAWPDSRPRLAQVQELPFPLGTPPAATIEHSPLESRPRPGNGHLDSWPRGPRKTNEGAPRPNPGKGWGPRGPDPKCSWTGVPNTGLGGGGDGSSDNPAGTCLGCRGPLLIRLPARHRGQAPPGREHSLGTGPHPWPLCWGFTPLTAPLPGALTTPVQGWEQEPVRCLCFWGTR